MPKISRREFLKSVSIGLGVALTNQLLAACGQSQPTIIRPTDIQPATPPTRLPAASTATPSSPVIVETPLQASATAISAENPYLVVARNGQPEELVRGALSALGGIQRFVSEGANVVVKPNICVAYHTYEYAATTNPWVVGALVKLCLEAGAASVKVMDYPFGGTAEEAYKISGIAEQVKAAGGEMVTMTRFKFVSTDLPDGKSLHKANFYEDALKADVLINVPIAKHHSLARLTLGMKNMMGLIADRPSIHIDLGQRLTDLAFRIRPTLTVIDAVRILMENGPTGGDLNDVKELNTVIASPDIVAADSYAATLFGLQPTELAYIRAGTDRGLGRSDLAGLNIKEINIGA